MESADEARARATTEDQAERHAGATADADAPRLQAEAGDAQGSAEAQPLTDVAEVECTIGISWQCVCGRQAGAPGYELAKRIATGGRIGVKSQCCGRTVVLKRQEPKRIIAPGALGPLNRQQRRALERATAKDAARQKGIGLVGPNGRPL